MALKNLKTEEMVAISQAWTSRENPARQAIEKATRLAPLLLDVERAHAAIYAVAPKPENPRKAEIARLSAEEDAVHDLLVRGIYGLLTELALLDDEGADLLVLRDRLVPAGISAAIHGSYRAQAGYAGLLHERLTPAVRDELARIPLRRGNLLERVEAWLAAASRLGALEEERARLEAPQGASAGMQTVEARNGWVQVVNAFVSVAVLAELDEATDRLIFGPLRDAEARADQRTARRRASATGTAGDGKETGGEVLIADGM